ncbi:MAG: type 1 glutamine amidotransferase [Phycisphaerales bacterium]|nr:type 1 glutamine amidotransferase [Phycisphaerales bacterium]
MPIIVFQHGERVGPGRLGATLRDHGFRMDVRRLDLHGPSGIPPDLDNVDAVISLGGEQNVGEPHDWMEPEARFLRAAHERELPVLGICLGHQLVAHALGGRTAPAAKPEWGFEVVSLNTTGQVEPLLSGLAWDGRWFQAHGQEVSDLPSGAALLASSPACKVQCFRAGLRTFGFQFHLECDRVMVDEFAASSGDSLARLGLSKSDVAAQADRHYSMFARQADRLCVNIVTYLFPGVRRVAG